MLVRAWAILGTVSAVVVLLGFFFVLLKAGWQPGDPVGPGSVLELDYRRATTMTFVGIVACQVGTALAIRTSRGKPRGFGSDPNWLLLAGIGFELAFTASLVFVPALHPLFGTAALRPVELLFIAPFPLVVWGTDVAVRRLAERSAQPHQRDPGRASIRTPVGS